VNIYESKAECVSRGGGVFRTSVLISLIYRTFVRSMLKQNICSNTRTVIEHLLDDTHGCVSTRVCTRVRVSFIYDSVNM